VPHGVHDLDALAGELWALGVVGLEELPHGLRAAFTEEIDAQRVRDMLAPTAPIEIFGDHHGLDGARDILKVERGGSFAVHPPWLDPPSDSQPIVIDPGHAFGSGSHASTRLALALIETEIVEGNQVLDIGCGTGVLAIAAALLGASAVAVDIDPAAVEATVANAARNGVDDRIRATLGSLDGTDQAVDLVMINVTIDIHEAIAPDLSHSPSRLLVAGLLGPDQLTRCADAYKASVLRIETDDGWMAAVLTRS